MDLITLSVIILFIPLLGFVITLFIGMKYKWAFLIENVLIVSGFILSVVLLYTKLSGYLGLFTFSMTGIVFTHNILMMYIFWELVGLSSYLLIGFWFEKKSASDAGKKAFIVNRVGGLGFLIGILINYATL